MTDLLWNLLAEFIGLVIGLIATYLIIDRVLKNREKRRWAASVQFIYAKLYDIVNDFLEKVVSIGSITGKGRENYVHFFGAASVMGDAGYTSIDSSQIFDHLQKVARLGVAKGGYDPSPMKDLDREMNGIVSQYMPLFDPELTARLLELDNSLRTLPTFIAGSAFKDDLELALALSASVEKAIAVRVYLENHATRSIKVGDHMKELRNEMKALTDKLPNLSSKEFD